MAQQRRLTDILQAYWNKLRGDRPFPSENEVNPRDIKDIWDSCFLIKASDTSDSTGCQYSYLGQEIINAYGDNLSKDEINILITPNKDRISTKVAETVKTQAPVFDESEFVNANSVIIRYRKIFLPLGDYDEVKYVLGGMRWKGL